MEQTSARVSVSERLNPADIDCRIDEIEQELQERYVTVGKVVLEFAEKENNEIGRLVDELIEEKKNLMKMKEKSDKTVAGKQAASM